MSQPATSFAIGRLGIPVPAFFPGDSETVAIGAVSAQSNAFECGLIRVISSVDCFLYFGANPTSTSGEMLLKAGAAEYFAVVPGEKLAVLQSSGGGTLYITPAREVV
jgi:hypothetical protein